VCPALLTQVGVIQPKMPTTILLADDHKIFRESLRLLLERNSDFRVTGEAANGLEAVQEVERQLPDVVVLDMSMPGLNGLDALREIKKTHPACSIVVLSSYDDEGYVVNALRQGAAAYVLKEQSAADLVQAVRTVLAGGRYLSPALSEEAVEDYLSEIPESTPEPPQDPYDTLTIRERQVLGFTAKGLTNAEIGQQLSISARTVETHRAHLMLKLGLRSRPELVRYAQQRQNSLLGQ
jgi:two-component system response regulator NreC